LEKEVIIDLFFIFAILQNLTSIEKKFYWSCEFQQLKQDVWVYKKEVINITIWGFAFGRAIEAQMLVLLLMFN